MIGWIGEAAAASFTIVLKIISKLDRDKNQWSREHTRHPVSDSQLAWQGEMGPFFLTSLTWF